MMTLATLSTLLSLFGLSPKLAKAIALILDPWQPSIEPELMIWRSA